MESDTYYWQTNGNGSEMISSNTMSMDGYMPQQQQVVQQKQLSDEDSSKSSLIAVTSSLQPTLYTQDQADTVKQESVNTNVDSGYTLGIVNPDAIEPKARSYTCRICQVTFPNKSAVTVHSRQHTDHQGKPYKCNFCGKGFSTNFYLKQHERIHSGQKPYKCPMCDHSFKQLSHVQQHVRTHTGVRPYKCHWPNCGKAFLQQSHLKSHEARHAPKQSSGARPFKCHWPDCNKTFAQLTNLRSHIARHTPGKGKTRKGGNGSKKTGVNAQHDESSSSFGLMSPQNVINQAAAAANIGPGVIVDEEAEIRPFLCPGCSKLYVREATFKKHLEECKTKLQLSINATASALGIDPPPPPPTSTSLEFDGNLLRVTTLPLLNTSSEQHSSEEPSERARLEVKQEIIAVEPQVNVQIGECEPKQIGVGNSPVSTNHSTVNVKEENHNSDNANFLSRQHLANDNNFKLPQIQETVSVYDVQTSESQLPIQNAVLMQTSDQERPHVLGVDEDNGDNSQLHTQSFSTTSADGAVPVMTQPATSSGSILLAQADEEKGSDGPTSQHSTINQAAIRWQWDQPVPRLNYP